LLEEYFFFWYYYRTPPWETRHLPIFERKWYIDRYVDQKEKENKELDRVRKKK
jgi:hypothetical protein